MSTMLRRSIPLTLTFIIVVSMSITYFFKVGDVGGSWDNTLLSWTVTILSAALGLGIINLFVLHGKRILRRTAGLWPYSVALILALLFTIAVGLIYGAASDEFNLVYQASVAPLNATLMSLFIVWMAPAFVRVIRLRNVASVLLFLAMLISIIGGSPLSTAFWPGSVGIGSWLNTVPNMAAQRGLKITIALGLIIMSVRIITGKEKSYLKEALAD